MFTVGEEACRGTNAHGFPVRISTRRVQKEEMLAVPTWPVHPGEATSATWTGSCRDGGPKDTRRPVRCAALPPAPSSSATGAPCLAWLSVDVCPAISPWESAAAKVQGQYRTPKLSFECNLIPFRHEAGESTPAASASCQSQQSARLLKDKARSDKVINQPAFHQHPARHVS